MLFSSAFFIFSFLPIFLTCFYLSPIKYRDITLLIASLCFYFWGEPSFCVLAIGSAGLDYILCQRIYKLGINNPDAKIYLTLGIVANLLILVYFKYTNFFLNNIAQLMHHQFKFYTILLPIGVSFIVFEKITYLVDIYRGVGKPADGILKYLNYVFLFPKLLAGPIIKYHEIENQLREREITTDKVVQGFQRFIVGLAKKVFIADVCGAMANQVFALKAPELSFSYAWLGIFCFTLQIYFDFSAYSDMALGLAKMLGFELRENFNMPYISSSFSEFWRRWHISLSTWIREYLYIPLGGNQVSQTRIYINLWICFLLSGLWHGANWTFVLWGAYNGFFLVLDRLIWLKLTNYLPKIIATSITLFFIMIGWVIFRATNFQQIQSYFYSLSHFSARGLHTAYLDETSDIFATLVLGFSLALIPLFPTYQRLAMRYQTLSWSHSLNSFAYGILGFFALCKMVGAAYTPFIYFNF